MGNGIQGCSYGLCRGNVPDRDIFLLGFIVDGDVRRLVNLRWLQNQHLQHRERKKVSVRCSVGVHTTRTSHRTGKRRRLVVPWVASTIMSIQKLSFSRRGECSTVCFLNLWIRCRFCTTDRKYLGERHFSLRHRGNECIYSSDGCKENRYFCVPERWLEFEELLSCLGGFRDVVGEHANSEELAHVPVIIHFLQGSFSTQKAVQPYA